MFNDDQGGNPVPITNIGHAAFNMKNEAAMLHFYRDILGMKELFTLTLRPVLERFESGKISQNMLSEQQAEYYAWLRNVADQPWITYLKLADRQFIELFYDLGRNPREITDRDEIFGYSKLNYEVDDAAALAEHLRNSGIVLKEDLHPAPDGSIEFSVSDPDGNEVRFTQYTERTGTAKAKDPAHKVCSLVNYTAQLTFDVQDTINMPAFYEHGLGLKKVLTVTAGESAAAAEKAPDADSGKTDRIEASGTQPRMEYYEAAPHQYIVLVYPAGGRKLREDRYLEDAYGYQHFCLEVSDVQAAYDAAARNGIRPETEISLGLAGSRQFWIRDPDGNRIELMEYTEGALQNRII